MKEHQVHMIYGMLWFIITLLVMVVAGEDPNLLHTLLGTLAVIAAFLNMICSYLMERKSGTSDSPEQPADPNDPS
jgi:ABC-type transport system involved in cytochrome c biogenesis permease component